MCNVKRMMLNSLLLITACLVGIDAMSQTPYGWRGPSRSGKYQETGLLKEWPAGGPELKWETLDAGKGYSSPVIVGDRIYLTGMNEAEDKEIFSAYTLDGKKIYEVVYGNPWAQSYPETRTTPAIDGGKAYLISGSAEIVCLNTADGSIVWKVDGGSLFENVTGNWGTAECPLVFDGKVIYTPSGDQTTMVALNAQTGETVWKSEPLGETGAYVSPILITYKGKRQIVGSTGTSVIGVNPETGKIEWKFSDWGRPPMPARPPRPSGEQGAPGGTPPQGERQRPAGAQGSPGGPPQQEGPQRPASAITVNVPVYHDGRIYYSQGYDVGSFQLQLADDLQSVSLVWRNSDLDTHHGGQLLLDGILYGSNWINNNSGNWVAVDWNTGETKYEQEWGSNGKGSIIAADGMLYAYDERRGTVGLIRPTPEKFDVVSEFRITKGEGPHWAHPVIMDGILYIRHGNAFFAYKIK